ncbi:hypothetical protein K2173_024424 [Erythroxylum novogranatense]|uniref:Pectinesterase inhibitor domain-containing protein n=1 Tax=Erythroxylum novogranatense TaxID=1862640 RepID=A0AAV8SVJ3_9ROSI|nr:hypothetical protein K2173_024424 [Erythroxylum novogranatense]
MMVSNTFCILLLLVFLVSSHATTSHNIIKSTCKICAKKDPNFSYNFCVTSLQAAPGSRCADLRELGIISMKLINHNLTDTRLYMKELLKDKKIDPFTRARLDDCLELYSDAIPHLKQAMADYKSNRYDDANIQLSGVMEAPTTCEDGFQEQGGAVSPLTKMNNDTYRLSALALVITNMLH